MNHWQRTIITTSAVIVGLAGLLYLFNIGSAFYAGYSEASEPRAYQEAYEKCLEGRVEGNAAVESGRMNACMNRTLAGN